MSNLEHVSFAEMIWLESTLRKPGDGTGRIEEAAERIVCCLQHHLVSRLGQESCGLVRLLKTHPLGEIDEERYQCAVAHLGIVAACAESNFPTVLLDVPRVRAEVWRPRRQRGTQ